VLSKLFSLDEDKIISRNLCAYRMVWQAPLELAGNDKLSESDKECFSNYDKINFLSLYIL
jgi:hypothetical protein